MEAAEWGRLVRSTSNALTRAAIRNWSSLESRTLPRSVRPKLRTAKVGWASDSVTMSRSFGFTTTTSEEISGLLMGSPTLGFEATAG
jgi:hypothetical protein